MQIEQDNQGINSHQLSNEQYKIDNSFHKYFETKKSLKNQKQKSNLSLSNPQLSYDSAAQGNSRVIQKQFMQDQGRYSLSKFDHFNQNYTSQSDLTRAMNYLKRKNQSIHDNNLPNQTNNQQHQKQSNQDEQKQISNNQAYQQKNIKISDVTLQKNKDIEELQSNFPSKQNSLDALKKKYLGTIQQNSDELKKNLQTPQQYEKAYQEKMRQISDFLNLPQNPQFQTANTAYSTNYADSIANSKGRGSTSQQLFSSNKHRSNQSQKNTTNEIQVQKQSSKREYDPISAHTSLLTASSFDHQSKLFGYPDYAFNQFKIDLLSQGLSVSKLSRHQFHIIQLQKKLKEKNQQKTWQDSRKVIQQFKDQSKSVQNDDQRQSKNSQEKFQTNKKSQQRKIDQKSHQGFNQALDGKKQRNQSKQGEKSASKSCNSKQNLENFRVASKTTESFKRKMMKEDDQKSSQIDNSFHSKSIQRWDKSPIVKKDHYHQHLKKHYNQKVPQKKSQVDQLSQKYSSSSHQNNQNENKKTHAFLTRLQPHLFKNFMNNYRKSISKESQNNQGDWMQLNISQKADKNKLRDLQVQVDLNQIKENQKVKFNLQDNCQSQKNINYQPQKQKIIHNNNPKQMRNSKSEMLQKPTKIQKNKYFSLTDNDEQDKKSHNRNKSSHNSILTVKQNKKIVGQNQNQDQNNQQLQQKKQYGLPFQQMDIISEKLKKFETDQQNRLKSLQNSDFNKTQQLNIQFSNRNYPNIESIKTYESKQNDVTTPQSFKLINNDIKNQSQKLSFDSNQNLQQNQKLEIFQQDSCKSRNKNEKKVRRVKNQRTRKSSNVYNDVNNNVNKSFLQTNYQQDQQDSNQKENGNIQNVQRQQEFLEQNGEMQSENNQEDIFSCWEQEKTGDGLIWQDSQMSDIKMENVNSENLEEKNLMEKTVIRVDQILNYQLKSESKNSQDQQDNQSKNSQDQKNNQSKNSQDLRPNQSQQINQSDNDEQNKIEIQENSQIQENQGSQNFLQKICMEYVDTQKNDIQKIKDNWSQYLQLDGNDMLKQKNEKIMRDFNNSAKVKSLLLSPRKESLAQKTTRLNNIAIDYTENTKRLDECSDFQKIDQNPLENDDNACSMFDGNLCEEQTVVKKINPIQLSLKSSTNDPTVVQKIQDFKKQLFFIQPFNELYPYSDNLQSPSKSQYLNSNRKNVQLTPKNLEIDQIIMKQINDSGKIKHSTPFLENDFFEQKNILYEDENKVENNNNDIVQNNCAHEDNILVTVESMDDDNEKFDQGSLKIVENLPFLDENENQLLIIKDNDYIKFKKFNSEKGNIRNNQLHVDTNFNDFENENDSQQKCDQIKNLITEKISDIQDDSHFNQPIEYDLPCQQVQNSPIKVSQIKLESRQKSIQQIKEKEIIDDKIIQDSQELANQYVFKLLNKIDNILRIKAKQIKSYVGSGRISNSENERQIQAIQTDYQNFDQIQSHLKNIIPLQFNHNSSSDSSKPQENQITSENDQCQKISNSFLSPTGNIKKNFVTLNSCSSSSYTKYIKNNQETKKFRQSQRQYFFTIKQNSQVLESSSREISSEQDKDSQTQSHIINNPKLVEVTSSEYLNDEIVLLNPSNIGPVYNSERGDCLKQNFSLQDYLFSPAAQQQNHFQTFNVPEKQDVKFDFVNIEKYLQNQNCETSNHQSDNFNGNNYFQFENPALAINESFNNNQNDQMGKDYLLDLEIMLKQYVLKNPQARLPYQLLFRLVWEAEGKILN